MGIALEGLLASACGNLAGRGFFFSGASAYSGGVRTAPVFLLDEVELAVCKSVSAYMADRNTEFCQLAIDASP